MTDKVTDKALKAKLEQAFGDSAPVPDAVSDPDLLQKLEVEFSKTEPVPETQSLEARRKSIADGMTLSVLNPFGENFDTGIEMPQQLTEFLAGAGKRLSEIGTLGNHEVDDAVRDLLNDSGYATLGEVAADIGALSVGGGALKRANIMKSAPSFVQSVLGGAAYGGATSNDRSDGALAGGLGAGVGHGITTGIAKAISPRITAGGQNIVDEGGLATPGELLGGTVKTLEDKLTSAPVLGDAITSAKKRSLEQYNKSVINDVLGTIGQTLNKTTKAGADAMAEAGKKISTEYDKILPKMTVHMDSRFAAEARGLRELVETLPTKQIKVFDNVFDEHIVKPFSNPNSMLLGRTFKESDTAIRKAYKKAYKSQDKQLGDAIRTLHKGLFEMAKRQNPVIGRRLEKLTTARAKLGAAESAASKLGAEDRVFGPSQLLNAIRARSDDATFASGRAFNQANTEAAKAILPNKIPDSGTAGRLMNMLAIGSAAYDPTALLALGAGATAYTRPGMKAIQALLTKGRGDKSQAARRVVEGAAPAGGLLGAAYGLQVD